MLKKLSEKLRARFPATTPGCSMLELVHLNDTFLDVFNHKQALYVEGESLQQREKKRRKKEGKKIPKIKRHTCRSLSHPKTISEF